MINLTNYEDEQTMNTVATLSYFKKQEISQIVNDVVDKLLPRKVLDILEEEDLVPGTIPKVSQLTEQDANEDAIVSYLYEREVKKIREDIKARELENREEKANSIILQSILDDTLNAKESYKKIDWEEPRKELPEVGNMKYLTEKLRKLNEPNSFYEEFRSPSEVDQEPYLYEELTLDEVDSEPDYLLGRQEPGFEKAAPIEIPKQGWFARLFSRKKRVAPEDYLSRTVVPDVASSTSNWSPVKEDEYSTGINLADYKTEKPSSEAVLNMLEASC